MKKTSIHKLIFVTLVFFSCNKSSNTNTEFAETSDAKLFPSGEDCKNPAGFNYKIQMEEAKEVSLEDLIDFEYPISIIPLQVDQPSNILGEVSKIWDYGDSLIYVADLQIANKVYGFERDGKMKFVIGEKGDGPGQFQQLWDVQYNLHHKRLELWDLPLHKMLHFGLDGQYIREQKNEQEIVSFYPVTKDWYVFHLDGRDHLGQKKPLLRYSDFSGKHVMKEGAWEYGVVDAWPSKLEFSEYKGSVYFLRAMMDTIYWIGPVKGQICPDYIIDFGADNISQDAKKQTDLMEAAKLIQEANSSFNTGNLVVGRTFLHFEWMASDAEEKIFHFVDRFEFQSYKIPAEKFSVYGIKIERVNFVDLHDFLGYSYNYKVNKEELQKISEDQKIHPETRKNILKLMEIEDSEMPFIIRFRLKHPKTE